MDELIRDLRATAVPIGPHAGMISDGWGNMFTMGNSGDLGVSRSGCIVGSDTEMVSLVSSTEIISESSHGREDPIRPGTCSGSVCRLLIMVTARVSRLGTLGALERIIRLDPERGFCGSRTITARMAMDSGMVALSILKS